MMVLKVWGGTHRWGTWTVGSGLGKMGGSFQGSSDDSPLYLFSLYFIDVIDFGSLESMFG